MQIQYVTLLQMTKCFEYVQKNTSLDDAVNEMEKVQYPSDWVAQNPKPNIHNQIFIADKKNN